MNLFYPWTPCFNCGAPTEHKYVFTCENCVEETEEEEETKMLTTFQIIHKAAVAAGQTFYDRHYEIPEEDDFEYYEMTERAEYCRPVAWLCKDTADGTEIICHATTQLEAFYEAADTFMCTVTPTRQPDWDGREFTVKNAIEEGKVSHANRLHFR